MTKVNWGVISSAKIATEHLIPAINKSSNSRFYAIASRDEKTAKKISKKFKNVKYYGSYNKLYKDKDVSIVYNPLPNHLHLNSTIEACKNKKHVLLEKPITLKSNEVDLLINASKKYKVIIKEAFMVRYHPQWQWIKKIIQKGELGKVKGISSIFSYSNSDPENIRNIKKYGGGALYDIGCYPILISRYILGKEPKKVVATCIKDKKFKTDILSSAILDFDGIHSTFICSTQTNKSQQVMILGTKKTLVIENPFNAMSNKSTFVVIYKGNSIYRKDNQVKEFLPSDQYSNQVSVFSNHVLKKTKIDFGLQDSKNNMKVIDSMFKSIKEKKWINI
jgi:predicted dehydrogenase